MKIKFIVIIIIFVLGSSNLLFYKTAQAYTFTNTFYYDNQNIKVGLETMKANNIVVSFNGDYSANSQIYKSGTSITIQNINGKMDIGGVELNQITFTPLDRDNLVTLHEDGKKRDYSYFGSIKFEMLSGGIMPIDIINIEYYLKGVIGYEMSESYPLESLKAQAVAARSYALGNIGKHGTEYDLCDTTDCQVYDGYLSSFNKVNQAVDDTKGQVLLSGTSVVPALFSADNGGYTEDSANVWGYAYSYYLAKKDSFDDYTKYQNSKNYDWTKVYTTSQIDSILKSKNIIQSTNKFIKIDLGSVTLYESGRVKSLNIIYNDSTGQQNIKTIEKIGTVPGTETFLNLLSGMYTITYDSGSDTYTFLGHGRGHALGMSQIGALNRGNAGQTYSDMLAFYYDGTVIKKGIASIGSFNQSESEGFTGDSITFSLQGQGGSGQGYSYRYVIEKAGTDVLDSEFSSQNQITYKPSKVGQYNVYLYLKDSLSKDEYDDMEVLTFNVTGPGDVNGDNVVDIFDLTLISKNIGQTKETMQNWNPKMDLTRDNALDITDLAKASQYYNIQY